MNKITERLSKIPPAARASTAFFISSVVTSGISYIITPVYTRILTAAEYGRASVFLTWLQIIGVVAMFCLNMGVFNNGMVDYPDRRDDYSFSLLILSNLITVTFALVLFASHPFTSGLTGLTIPLLVLMFLIYLSQPAYNFWVSHQRYEYRYKYVVFWAVLCAVLSPMCAILACLGAATGNRLYPRLFGAEIPLILIYAGFYVHLGRKAGFKIDRSFWKPALLFNLPLIPHYLSTYLLNSCDRIMISRLVGDSATAYYSVAYSVAAVATIVWSAVNSSLIPFTYEKCRERRFEEISRVVIPILTLFAVVCLFVILLAPEVVAIMASGGYRKAIYVIPPIVGGVFFQVQYYIYANIVYYYKKPKYVMYASVTATVANIILNYIFIRRYGYIAAGYTTLACYIIQVVFDYVAMRKTVGRDVYNMKYILSLSAAVTAIALISSASYDYPIVRYVLASAIALAALMKRKTILEMIFHLKKN